MTDRTRDDRPVQGGAEVYETAGTSRSVRQPAMAGGVPQVDVENTIVTPTDRVRWGSILAGLFTALSTLLVLTLIGLAIGAASYDPGDGLAASGSAPGSGAA